MLLLLTATAFAADTAEVYADPITAATDKTILIPVKIENNSGIMGFKITVNYDESVLSSPKVTKGDITQNGMLNDSVGVTHEGSFDVVWSSTQNEVGDGTLFIISFTSVKTEDTQIKLSFSRPDTFNEAWEDVELKCSDISVKFSTDATETEKKPATPSNQPITPPGSDEIKNAVDIVLGETGKGHIDEIPEEERSDFIDRTNEILGQLTGQPEKLFENVDEIKDAYNGAVSDEFVDGTKEAVDSNKIESAIKDSLASVGAESIEQIPAEKKEGFVQKVENGIAQYAPDVDTISDKLTADEAVKVIQQLQSENEVAATEGVKLPDPPKNNTASVVIITALVLLFAIITVTVVYIKRKKNKEEK